MTSEITSGFPFQSCRCGAEYCVGTVTRRAMQGVFDRSTAFFLGVDNGYTIAVDRRLIRDANAGTEHVESMTEDEYRERVRECLTAYNCMHAVDVRME